MSNPEELKNLFNSIERKVKRLIGLYPCCDLSAIYDSMADKFAINIHYNVPEHRGEYYQCRDAIQLIGTCELINALEKERERKREILFRRF